jgi:Uncharacterized Fe-S protein
MSDQLRLEISALIHETVAAVEPEGLIRRPRVGFASAEDPLFDEIPQHVGVHHLHPRDILPEVATVVAFFLPFTQAVVKSNRGSGPVSPDWGRAYLRANELINGLSQALIELAIRQGGRAAAVPATHTFDEKTLKAGWSHRSAAYVAGLGRFGLNRMLIGPNGCCGRFGSVFISQRLAPDPLQREDYCLFLKNGKCQACFKACPAQALTPETFDGQKCYAWLLDNSTFLNLDGRLVDVCGKCAVAGPCAFMD